MIICCAIANIMCCANTNNYVIMYMRVLLCHRICSVLLATCSSSAPSLSGPINLIIYLLKSSIKNTECTADDDGRVSGLSNCS